MCIGGQGASVLSKTFNVCGMSFGNTNTHWLPEFNTEDAEHSFITSIMAWVWQRPRNEWENALRGVLQSYKIEAEIENWKVYGIKTTSGICKGKWDCGVGDILKEEWPTSLYFGVYREPNTRNPNSNLNWNSVWVGRKGMVDRGGIFVRFPDCWRNGLIKEIVKAVGLSWKEEANFIYKDYGDFIPSVEELEIYYNKFPEEKEQRFYLLKKSEENLQFLKGLTICIQ
jgi:hypothetical protein